MKKLFLVDAYALIYRNYYAFLGRPMRNKDGVNTSAIFGFTKFIRDIIKRENPQYMGVAFDPKGETFRHIMYPLYKANRTETPEDIHASVPYIKRILEAMRIPILEVAGYEADDVIGTMAYKAEKEGFDVYMVTPDKDFGQLVTTHSFIYKQGKSGEGYQVIGCEALMENYGISDPRLIIDILALWGDASDNIPGVPGIGEKGAVKLVNAIGTVEQILANTDKLAGKQKENIIASKEQLMISKRLATIDQDVPIEFRAAELKMEDVDCDALREVYAELEFGSFIREMDGMSSSPFASGYHSAGSSLDKAAGATQGDLFSAPAGQPEHITPPAEVEYQTIDTVEHDYATITSERELEQLITALSEHKQICFDTETTGINALESRAVGMSFAVEPGRAYYVPLDDTTRDSYTRIIRPLMENGAIAKIGQNIKFDIIVLRGLGIDVRGFKYDTMLMHYLLDPESRHGMDHLARTFLHYSPIEIGTLIGRGAKQITMDMVPVERVSRYAAEDADVTLRLKQLLWPMVVEAGFERLYSDIEEPLIDVLVGMEVEGVRIDSAILADSGREITGELAGMEDRIREHIGEPSLNVNSARQLGQALFGKMKIDSNPKMTKTKQYRTDEEYLVSLSSKHPVIEDILEYRGLRKLLSTYVEALPLLVNKNTNRLHTSFNQAVASTGRLSSSNPNLQNIPIRDSRGREIRKAFVPADGDHLLLSADYSQVELRIMAHLSGDAAMIEAFANKEDIHAATAARLFAVDLSAVTSDQRRKAKTANFGIIYGISAFGLSQRLNIPRMEAKEIIDGYFRSFPAVKEYMDRVIAQAREDGSVSTIFGRRRQLADINSRNAVARAMAERNAINAPIQGSAADIMKIAMIKVFDSLAQLNLRSKLIIQVHDELIIDMHKSEQEQVAKLVVGAMESAADLAVPLTVDYNVGADWLQAH